MTGDMAFLSSEILILRLSVPNVSQTLFISNSPITRDHKPTDWTNGLAKESRHERR
jgi:hypothetical protein